MAKLSIGGAFSESIAFLRENWLRMLIWFGGALLLLALLAYLMLGSTIAQMAAAEVGGPPDPSSVAGMMGNVILLALLGTVLLYAVSMIIWRGGLHPGEAPNMGWAFQAGPAFAFGMLVVMIVAYILIAIVSFILVLIFGAALGMSGGFSPEAMTAGAMGGGAIAVIALYYIGVLLFLLWVQARFSVAGPIMADRLTRNPVTGLSESWRLTGMSQWRIVGFYVIFAIGTIIYAALVGAILGAVLAASSGGLLVMMTLSAMLIYLPLLMLSFSLPVGIYRSIAPRASGDVFA